MAVRDPEHAPKSAPSELDAFTLRRAARGDERAAREFVQRYSAPVFGLVSRMLVRARPAEVEDLAQEVFLRAFRALPRFDVDGPAKVSSWLLTIATRACIDELRRKRPEVAAAPIDARDQPTAAAHSSHPDRSLANKELREHLRAELAALPPDQRAALVLYEFHGWSYQAIADFNDQPVGTVRSRISRARARLRQRLNEVLR